MRSACSSGNTPTRIRPNIDVGCRASSDCLRKKFKDPITNDDFAIIPVGRGSARMRERRPASAAAARQQAPQQLGAARRPLLLRRR